MDLYIVVTLIGFMTVFATGLAVGFRTADRRAADRTLAVLARVDALSVSFTRRALPAPAGRGLQRLPVVVLPSVARRVVDVTRDSETPEGAIVDVEFSPDERFDSTGGRWLKHVVSSARSMIQPTEDDTPEPPGQRSPVLPPPSSSGQRSRR